MKAVEKCYATLVGFCWLSHIVYATIAHYPNSLGIIVETLDGFRYHCRCIFLTLGQTG